MVSQQQAQNIAAVAQHQLNAFYSSSSLPLDYLQQQMRQIEQVIFFNKKDSSKVLIRQLSKEVFVF